MATICVPVSTSDLYNEEGNTEGLQADLKFVSLISGIFTHKWNHP